MLWPETRVGRPAQTFSRRSNRSSPGLTVCHSPGDERFDLLEKVCAGRPTRVSGQSMSIFDYQAVVRDALMYGPR